MKDFNTVRSVRVGVTIYPIYCVYDPILAHMAHIDPYIPQLRWHSPSLGILGEKQALRFALCSRQHDSFFYGRSRAFFYRALAGLFWLVLPRAMSRGSF